jgi:hypothetical protein
VVDELVEAVRLAEVVEQPVLPLRDDRGVPFERLAKGGRALDQPAVMRGHVVAGFHCGEPSQAALEVVERGPGVAVVRPESGQVHVAGEEDAVGLDEEGTVPPRVSRGVKGADHDVAAE